MSSEDQLEAQLIDTIQDEQDDFYSDDDLYNINSWGADLSFRELIDRYRDGELLKPEMQRNYVWDMTEASRFIDSILLGLPIPSIFLAKTQDERMLIIDGYQRIMTVYDYVRGIFAKDEKVFRLTNSEKINARWRGKVFDDLSDAEQRKIKNTTIHCIIFVQVKPRDNDTSLYQVFERINTSGRTLLPQEIRNCVYQGKFNTLLLELNKDALWRKMLSLEKPDPRMRDVEFILRFFALGSNKLRRDRAGQISLKKFLNDFMGDSESKDDNVLTERKTTFLQTVQFIYNNLGVDAFQNISPLHPEKMSGKFNPTIFDSVMIATRYAIRKGLKVEANELKARRIMLLQDKDYQDVIRFRTTNVERIEKRIAVALKHLYNADYEQ